MSIPLTGTGGLFTRLGHLGGLLNAINLARGTTIPGHITTIAADYESTDQSQVSGLYPALTGFQGGQSSLTSYIKTLAKNVLVQMAADDAPQPNSGLSNALAYLINQMSGASQTVQASVVGSSIATGGSNVGNTVLRISDLSVRGLTLENVLPETLTATITQDAQTGSVTAGQERLSIVGQAAVSDPLSYLWPGGSGSSKGLTLIDASSGRPSSASMTFGGSFETFTANVPAGWTVDVGTAGSNILKSTAQFYDGATSLQLAGDGTTLVSVYQQFNSSTGSGATLAPLTPYVVNLWAKMDATPAAGVLEVALTDGSGTITQDAQGNNNSFTTALTTLGTSWVAIGGFFRTPAVIPSTFRLRIRFSTALSNGKNCFIDRVSFAPPAQLYPQGPYVGAFSGNVNAIKADTWGVTITNTRGGFQGWFDRFFNMRQLGLLLPSSGSPTISDSLIA